VHRSARENPSKFYIGIDANRRPLEKISEKIHRRAAKGGLPNVLFVEAAVENLPAELSGVADQVYVHFPWGSLLRGVAGGDGLALENLRRICASSARLEVVIGLDPDRDRAEIERLGLEPITDAYIEAVLVPRYREAGFEIVEKGAWPAPALRTSWAKRLAGNAGRSVTRIVWRVLISP